MPELVTRLAGRVTHAARIARLARIPGLARNGAPQGFVSLDIGTELAKALVVGVEAGPDGELGGVVRGVGRRRQGLAHMQSGTVSDIEAVVANCAAALHEAREMAGLHAASAVIGIAGELVKGATSRIVVRREEARQPIDEAELAQMAARSQQAALADAEDRIAWEAGIPQLDVRLVHAAIVEVKIDGYPVTNPIGFTGAQVEMAVYDAFAPMVHLGALRSVAAALDLELLGVIAEPYAVAGCLEPGELGDVGAVFVDVGGGTTDVALVRQGGLVGTRMLAFGGRAFTRGIAERFGLSFARAEALKLAAARRQPLPEKVRRRALDAALREDAEVWRAGVSLMIDDLAGGELLPGRVLLCGGGANLPQVVAALEDDAWWRELPFGRRPDVRALDPEAVAGVRDGTGLLTTRQEVTPLALARQALLLDEGGGVLGRAVRSAVRSMEL